MQPESNFEQKWSKKAAARGWMPVKIIQASMNGLPDRMYLKDGKVFFIEFKAKNGKLRDLQRYRIEQLRKKGFHCFVFYAPF
jgi:hypothetical protein